MKAPETQPVVLMENVNFSYNGRTILEGVNLKISEGDFLAVIGPNGGGKTTLLKLILGLLKPDRGRIELFGSTPGKNSTRVGYVPQDGGGERFFPITAWQVVLMGLTRRLRFGGRFSDAEQEAARKALEKVDMWDYRSRRIGRLSGGQRQRVLLARAIVDEPRLLLLDEPTTGVDQKGQMDLYQFLREHNREMTIIVVSHDQMVLSSHVRQVACVNRKVIWHDAPEITRDMLEFSFGCPVELVAHGGLPHRVLQDHED